MGPTGRRTSRSTLIGTIPAAMITEKCLIKVSESANAANQHRAIEKTEPGQKIENIDPQNAR